jgi:hypothetical protein
MGSKLFNTDQFRVVRGSVIVVWVSQVACICLRQSFRLQLCLCFDFKGWYLRLWKPQVQNERQFSSPVQYVQHTDAVCEQLFVIIIIIIIINIKDWTL